MKTIKTISLILTLTLIFGGFLISQEKAKDQELFEKAKKFIYQKEWMEAVKELDKITEEFKKSKYLAESLYWLGYSLDRYSSTLTNMEKQLEIKEDALKHLDSMIISYSTSSWADDAKVLRVQIAEELVKNGLPEFRKYINGSLESLEGLEGLEGLEELGLEDLHPEENIDPELELKLVALNALLNVDEEKAFPIVEKIVRKSEDAKLRERAVFILGQSKDSRVTPLMAELAAKDSDLRVKECAIFWLGQRKDKESLDTLLKIYDTETDTRIKEKLLFAFSQNKSKKAREKLLDIAKNDKDMEAREKAIFWIGEEKNEEVLDILSDMYSKTDNVNLKKRMIFSISQNKSDKAIKMLIELAKKEKDYELKKQIVFWLGQSKNKEALEFLKEIIEK